MLFRYCINRPCEESSDCRRSWMEKCTFNKFVNMRECQVPRCRNDKGIDFSIWKNCIDIIRNSYSYHFLSKMKLICLGCDRGYICNRGYCVPRGCNDDKDCKSNQECLKGECKDLTCRLFFFILSSGYLF